MPLHVRASTHRHRRHRRASLSVLGGICLAFLAVLVSSCSPAPGSGRASRFDVRFDVAADGSIDVTESIAL
ncbi:MAG: hypothetical protein ABI652_00660, partial [Acidobacteriota bacterium]